MTDMIRCPACRGSKKVPKLGGMIGDCNTCLGKGEILASDKPVPVIVEPVVMASDIVKQVADIQPAPFEGNIPVKKIQAAVDTVSSENKRAIFKRKKA